MTTLRALSDPPRVMPPPNAHAFETPRRRTLSRLAMLSILLGLLILAPYRASAAGEAPLKEPPISGDQELAVAIDIPLTDGQRVIRYGGKDPTFPVVLTNLTDHPLRIWQDWNSWGYYNLSFELTTPDGKVIRIDKGERAWTRNFPSSVALAPHDSFVFNVHFSDKSTWSAAPFPRPAKDPETYTLRAIFGIPPDEFTKKYEIWTGHITSKPEKYTFYSGN